MPTTEQRIAEMRRVLSEQVRLEEVRHVTTFKAYRGKDRVVVEIEDAGADSRPSQRYRCYATTEDGRIATGNPAGSTGETILITHWNKLDG